MAVRAKRLLRPTAESMAKARVGGGGALRGRGEKRAPAHPPGGGSTGGSPPATYAVVFHLINGACKPGAGAPGAPTLSNTFVNALAGNALGATVSATGAGTGTNTALTLTASGAATNNALEVTAGSVKIDPFALGLVHSSAAGVLTSSAVNLASA